MPLKLGAGGPALCRRCRRAATGVRQVQREPGPTDWDTVPAAGANGVFGYAEGGSVTEWPGTSGRSGWGEGGGGGLMAQPPMYPPPPVPETGNSTSPWPQLPSRAWSSQTGQVIQGLR